MCYNVETIQIPSQVNTKTTKTTTTTTTRKQTNKQKTKHIHYVDI